ncbi:hypothetical protein D6D15_05505 [Aureobasidium pullulans]|uniref:Uncharacterized protein n=1 Tax=Aureobasidium pullulans TaxID=5580 RepID=A0A4V4IVF6_AURPU|nr:hypothetical protein D6D15_05505 [Aureobasidium pullulans]
MPDKHTLGAPSTASDVAKIVTTIRKKQKTESGAKATKNDGDTEDEESKVEEESIETTKRKFRGDTNQGLDNVQSLAHETRENAATIQSTLALNIVGKERTTSDLLDMAEKAIPVVYDLPHTGREEYEGAPPRQL